jgi:hypothetical protein
MSFLYPILQFGSAVLVLIFIIFLNEFIKMKFKTSWVTSILIIGISYFIIGILTYNVKKERIGAVCCDEWNSSATSSGACSSHGGVREWEIKYYYEEYVEPFNTVHKIFYFWYALNENHMELDYVGCDDEDDFYEPSGIGTE